MWVWALVKKLWGGFSARGECIKICNIGGPWGPYRPLSPGHLYQLLYHHHQPWMCRGPREGSVVQLSRTAYKKEGDKVNGATIKKMGGGGRGIKDNMIQGAMQNVHWANAGALHPPKAVINVP